MEKKRNSKFELMRIVSMFLIVIWHIILHGHVIENCTNPAIRMMLELSLFLIIIHVNSFVLLSGYFQSKSKFKLSKMIKIFLQVVFYSILIVLVSIKIGWLQEYTIVTFLNNITLSSLDNYWFIKMYLIMYIFSDYINKFIDRMTRGEYKKFLLVSFVLLSIIPYITGYKFLWNDGYTFFHFIYMYMIGGYLRRYPLKETYHFKNMSKNGYRILLLFCFITLGIMNYLFNHVALEMNGTSHIFTEIYTRIHISYLHYATPFAIVQTILYFEIFKTLNFQNKWINKLAGCMFGVYLIHDNVLVREHIYKLLQIDSGSFNGYMIFPKIFIVAIIIFIVCLLVEYMRLIVSRMLCSSKIVQKFIGKFKKFVNSFNFQINW